MPAHVLHPNYFIICFIIYKFPDNLLRIGNTQSLSFSPNYLNSFALVRYFNTLNTSLPHALAKGQFAQTVGQSAPLFLQEVPHPSVSGSVLRLPQLKCLIHRKPSSNDKTVPIDEPASLWHKIHPRTIRTPMNPENDNRE